MKGNLGQFGLSDGHTGARLAINPGSAIINYVAGILIVAYNAGATAQERPGLTKAGAPGAYRGVGRLDRVGAAGGPSLA